MSVTLHTVRRAVFAMSLVAFLWAFVVLDEPRTSAVSRPKTTKTTKTTKATSLTKAKKSRIVATTRRRALPARLAATSDNPPTTATTATTPATTPPTAAPTSPIPPPIGPIVGLNMHPMWADASVYEQLLDRAAALGVTWVRMDVGWNQLEPGDGVWDERRMAAVDRILHAAKDRGVRVLIVFLATPAWASADGRSTDPPRDPARYGFALARLATRFKGRIGAVQVWNEANKAEFFSGSVVDYVRVLGAAHNAVRAVDPTLPIVLSGPSSNDTRWFDEMYAAGGKNLFDIASVQPYPSPSDDPPDGIDRGPTSIAHLQAVRDLLVARGDGDVPLWVTEIGWSAHENDGTERPWKRGVSDSQQSANVLHFLSQAQSEYPWIKAVFLYNFRDRLDADLHENSFGVLRSDLSPKPLAAALSQRAIDQRAAGSSR